MFDNRHAAMCQGQTSSPQQSHLTSSGLLKRTLADVLCGCTCLHALNLADAQTWTVPAQLPLHAEHGMQSSCALDCRTCSWCCELYTQPAIAYLSVSARNAQETQQHMSSRGSHSGCSGPYRPHCMGSTCKGPSSFFVPCSHQQCIFTPTCTTHCTIGPSLLSDPLPNTHIHTVNLCHYPHPMLV